MNTIYLLKQIIDLIYEESKYKTKLSDDALSKLGGLERELAEKNKEVARLYTENIKLENTVRQFEADFELMANICGEPTTQTNETVENNTSNVPDTHIKSDTNESTTHSKKKTKPKMATQDNMSEVKIDSVKNEVEVKVEEEVKVEPEKPIKKDRRNYMREYQREYRKKQREEKISMTV
jgi:hypothetical protein